MFSSQISILILATIGVVASQTCNFQKSAVKANWKIVNGALQIQYQNNRITNNQWTAVGFGPGMSNLNVIVFMVQNGQITTRTGRTTGYGPPVFDNQNNINVSMANHSGSTLNALVSVPLNFNGMNVQNCQTWNFVQSGPINNGQMGVHTSRPDQVNNVCASQCR
ncbi:Protein CBG21752 [Caenorhabditis briggsae]|nr:Protein CBG21752 [Caenorhabditis briggsae]CAP38424.1 Protein CBG21752 [Caenorhabditis briggsae]